MNSYLIFGPMLAQMFLTVGMFGLLALRKARATRFKQVNLKQSALDHNAWPDDVVKVSNNIANQFETPVLFYIACFVLFELQAISMAVLALSWLYVATRVVHGLVHVRSNHVPSRLKAFAAGALILLSLMFIATWELVDALGT